MVLASGFAGVVYTGCKDMATYINNKVEYTRRLEQNLMCLTIEIVNLHSKKERVDRILNMPGAMLEKSPEYDMLVENLEFLFKKHDKFLNKYEKATGHIVLPQTQETEASNKVTNVSLGQIEKNRSIMSRKQDASRNIIRSLRNIEPTKWSSHLRTLGNLSEDVEKLYQHANTISNQMKLENMTLNKGPKLVIEQNVPFNLPQFDRLYVDKIMTHLEKEKVKRIGLLGPIGVGKTTVMKMLNNRLSLNQFNSRSSFDPYYVIWISLPDDEKDKVVEIMQDTILNRLQVDQEQIKTCRNANDKRDKISRLLSEMKYIVLIDQVSSNINLDDIGIYRNHKFGKVVASSNKTTVTEMIIDEEVEMQRLSTKEAAIFFENTCEIEDERCRDTAERITELCEGLPLVINLVANYLRVASEGVWNDVERTLKEDPKPEYPVKGLAGVAIAHEKVYKELEDTASKNCSIYGAMFPKGYRFDRYYLIECWMAESFLDQDKIKNPKTGKIRNKLGETRDHGEMVLKELTDRYLLELCFDDKCEYVRMPFYFRKVALQQKFFVEEENTVFEPPVGNILLDQETWGNVKRLSVINCQLSSHLRPDEGTSGTENRVPRLPESPVCINLQTLFLKHNEGLAEVGASFFLSMKNLIILDLNCTGIKLVPSSISCLSSLISLYLNDCPHLEEIPPEAEDFPKKLELLDIRGTSLRPWLPLVIGSIRSLRCLKVSLNKERCPDSEENERNLNISSFEIIRGLELLEELIIDISDDWRNAVSPIADAVANLEHLSTLYLGEFHFTKWREAKVCRIKQLNSLECVVDNSSQIILQNLVKLHLSDLKSLRYIWNGSAALAGCLSKLKVLTIRGCFQLTQILTPSLAMELSGLKGEDGSEHVKIATRQSNPDNPHLSDFLHNLERIELVNLPLLQSICDGTSMNWNSLMTIKIERCPQLRNLPFTPANAVNLASIKCSKTWWTKVHFEAKNKFACDSHDEGESSSSVQPDNPQAEINRGADIREEETVTYRRHLVQSNTGEQAMNEAEMSENENTQNTNAPETNATLTISDGNTTSNDNLIPVSRRRCWFPRVATYFCGREATKSPNLNESGSFGKL